jgi:hypothetical protein
MKSASCKALQAWRAKIMGRIWRVMTRVQQALALLRALLAVCVLGLTLAGGYWVYHTWSDKIRYERYLHNLLAEQRLAEVCVSAQERIPHQAPRTTLRFQEFRQDGQALPSLSMTLPGEEIYIDALVTVFESDAVQSGEARSLYLFRRIFTERVAPQDGFPLYHAVGSSDGIPEPYVHRTIERSAQLRVWHHLWRLIEDTAYAEAHRVRTHFGQAVYARMEPGRCYTVTLQNHGGLLLNAPTH